MTRIKKRFSKITMGFDNLTCRKYILIFTLQSHTINLYPRVYVRNPFNVSIPHFYVSISIILGSNDQKNSPFAFFGYFKAFLFF